MRGQEKIGGRELAACRRGGLYLQFVLISETYAHLIFGWRACIWRPEGAGIQKQGREMGKVLRAAGAAEILGERARFLAQPIVYCDPSDLRQAWMQRFEYWATAPTAPFAR
jgi:hypothetical protein